MHSKHRDYMNVDGHHMHDVYYTELIRSIFPGAARLSRTFGDLRALPLIVAMPFSADNSARDGQWMAELGRESCARRGDVPSLSGRAWVSVAPKHCRAHYNAQGDYGTIALCHSGFRHQKLRIGDCMLFVSPPGPLQLTDAGSNPPRGGRLLLGVWVEDGRDLTPSTYHSVLKPKWAHDRADNSYICRVLGCGERGNRAALKAC
jgi:hypothetical protein